MNLTITTLATAITLSMSVTGYSATIAYGVITDQANDAIQDDLVSASIAIDNLFNVTFEVHFRSTSFVPGTSYAEFCLDLDKNPATGFSGVNANHDDGSLIGTNALIQFPYYQNPYAVVYYNVTNSSFPTQPTHYGFTTLADGYRLTLPLADLGATNTQMNFKVVSSRGFSDFSSTGIQDYMTNFGAPVGTVVNVPEPSALALLGIGVIGLVSAAARRRKR